MFETLFFMHTMQPLSCCCSSSHQTLYKTPQLRSHACSSSSSSSRPSPIPSHAKFGDFSEELAPFGPEEYRLARLLKLSTKSSDLTVGMQLHARSVRTGVAYEPGVRASLIAMYSACGHLNDACKVFDEVPPLPETDAFSWNSIISAHTSHGWYDESFRLFFEMLEMAQLAPTDATYVSMIGACASAGNVELGRVLHAMVIKDEKVGETKMLNCLITMYAKCGELEDANRVFEEAMNGSNIVSWNAIISGHELNGEWECALSLSRRLTRLEQQISVKPNRITVLSILSSISSVSVLKLGREVHAQVIKSGLEFETSIGNAIITMYGKCGDVTRGRLVFERLPCRDLVTWNSMLAGYAKNKQAKKCYELFTEMISREIRPDDHTLTNFLGAFSDPVTYDSFRIGREIHRYLLQITESTMANPSTYTALLSIYARSKKVGDSEKLFMRMNKQNTYSWNAMMDGYCINGYNEKAIELFVDLHKKDVKIDHMTLSILLTASSKLVSIKMGKQFHAFALKHHFGAVESTFMSVNNALVSMYSKCGSISDAASVFQRMVRRDVFSWTAMITGYAHHGMANKCFELFEGMKQTGIKPNSVTFLGLITACAHGGLINEGTNYFTSMSRDSGIEPTIEHYACMVDLYGRSGQLDRAEDMVRIGISNLNLEVDSCLCLWKVLLGACHAHRQLEHGIRVAKRIFEIDPEDETPHVLLSNLYASFSLWEDAAAVRRSMKDRALKKEVGCSWVELSDRKHVFVAGDVCHPERKEIYEKLEDLVEKCKGVGYVPMTQYVLHDVDEAQKEAILMCHSEKLAVSFALLHVGSKRSIIRVIKNLRVCGDCHNWMKFASQVEGREIVLRDSRRFHIFKDGTCTCGDYW